MPRILIAGCGFVGLATARLLHSSDWQVTGMTHSAESAAALTGEPFAVVQGDLSQPSTLATLPIEMPEVIIHCASSGRGGAEQYRAVYLQGCQHLSEVFPAAHLIFTSSTSVYGQNDGTLVTEDDPAEPGRETGQILRQTEELVLGRGGCVARLAGIYGPGRSVLLRKFFSGEAVIEGENGRFVNQVHRDDVAAGLGRLATLRAAGIFNLCDDTSLTHREIYTWLAEHFDRPVPPVGPVDENRKRGVTNKRVSNAKLKDLGWQPAYPSFRDAVANDPALVAALEIAS